MFFFFKVEEGTRERGGLGGRGELNKRRPEGGGRGGPCSRVLRSPPPRAGPVIEGAPARRGGLVRARARGYAQVRQVVQVPSGSSPDQVTVRDVRLRFQRGAQLTGQVRGPQGNVEGADLQVRSDDGQTVAQARSDRRGAFELTDLPPGRLRLAVSCAQGQTALPIELGHGGRQRPDVEIGTRSRRRCRRRLNDRSR